MIEAGAAHAFRDRVTVDTEPHGDVGKRRGDRNGLIADDVKRGRSVVRDGVVDRDLLATWVDQFGTSDCVGCGRCITWCPVGIDITEEVRAIRETPPQS